MILFGLLLLPFVIGAIVFFVNKHSITWQEYLLCTVISAIFAFGGWQFAKYQALQSIEHWNGRITKKRSGTESCCHCITVCDNRDKDGNCTSSHEDCDHIHDYWWAIDINTGDTINDDCNGSSIAPNWWKNAYVNEPAVVEHKYQNYLLADKDSLMTPAAETYIDKVQSFPEVYNRYKVKRYISDGVSVPINWQKELDELNADLGNRHQVDVLFYVTKKKNPDFAESIKAKWVYGPKNSLTIVMGVKNNEIIWARVVSFSDINEFKINIRDELPGKKLSDPDLIPFIRSHIEKEFKRTPMATYDYLANQVTPPWWLTMLLYLVDACVILGLLAWAHNKDIFGSKNNRHNRHYFNLNRHRWH